MTDTQQDSTPETSLETPAPEAPAPTDGAGLTVPEMREWLRNWIAKATGVSPDRIDDSAPMVEMGLSSRDAVAMAADIEDLTGSPSRPPLPSAPHHRVPGHPHHRG